jgi:hypothetical protein
MGKNLICSAGSKEQLEQMINRWYLSENYVITKDNGEYRAYNKKLKRYSEMLVKEQGGRWRFERPGLTKS